MLIIIFARNWHICSYGDGALRFDDDVYEACVKIARLAVTRRIISNQQLQHAYAEGSPSTDAETRRVTEYVAYLSPCVPYPDLAKTITTETCIQFVHTVPAARFISKKDSTPNGTGSVMDGRLVRRVSFLQRYINVHCRTWMRWKHR